MRWRWGERWSWRCCLQGEWSSMIVSAGHLGKWDWTEEIDGILLVVSVVGTRSTSIVFAINSHPRG
jgi:hypothetical protein